MNNRDGHYKDGILNDLAQSANIAQFVSFAPDLTQRHAWIHGHEPNYQFDNLTSAVRAILAAAPENSVNIRSFEPDNPKSREFIYGKKDVDTVVSEVRRLAGDGLHTIINETVDIHDGGVSGVAYGDVIEFAPEDIPRCVEKPGTAAFARDDGFKLFEMVYGFRPTLPSHTQLRVEFSLHPLRRGYRHEHTIIWEIEDVGHPPTHADITWPNRFSRFVGDKAFGLMVAHLIGQPVPRTQVIPRKTAPFVFGTPTGNAEIWIRTCPTEQVPGLFTTKRGWLDPYQLMEQEDPTGEKIASLLCQQGVDAKFSGSLIAQPDGEPLIEGVEGFGDDFMVGQRAPETLPASVTADLIQRFSQISDTLGPIRFEWVHDGDQAWVVQLHKGASVTAGKIIFPGEAPEYHRFDVGQGIDSLRELIKDVADSGDGIILVGRVGVTSHFGDLLRRAQIPSRIEEPPAEPAQQVSG